MNAHVEDLVDFGWFTVLALPMFRVMKWIHGVFGNYGVAIILLDRSSPNSSSSIPRT